MPSRPSLDFSEYLPYLINRVGSALVVDFGRSTLARHRLSIAMWRVLAALSSDDGQRQIDLAAMTSIDVSTLSRVVTRLVKMGLVTRTRSATNSREVVVRLTAQGRGDARAHDPAGDRGRTHARSPACRPRTSPWSGAACAGCTRTWPVRRRG